MSDRFTSPIGGPPIKTMEEARRQQLENQQRIVEMRRQFPLQA